MKELKWVNHGSVAIGKNPKLMVQRCELGIGKDGRTWICEASPQLNVDRLTGKWIVKFDTTEESEDDWTFLRKEVTDAPEHDYWKKRREVYHEKVVDYHAVQDVIEDFMKANGIN